MTDLKHMHPIAACMLATMLFASAVQAQDAAPVGVAQGVQAAPVGVAPFNLFIPADAPPNVAPHRGSRSSIAAFPDLGRLGAVSAGGRFTLNVAPGVELPILVSKVERRTDASFSVFGEIETMVGSYVILAVEEDALAATISSPPNALYYRTRYAGNGVHLVCNIDETLLQPCGTAPQLLALPGEDPVPEAWEAAGLPDPTQFGGYNSRARAWRATTSLM